MYKNWVSMAAIVALATAMFGWAASEVTASTDEKIELKMSLAEAQKILEANQTSPKLVHLKRAIIGRHLDVALAMVTVGLDPRSKVDPAYNNLHYPKILSALSLAGGVAGSDNLEQDGAARSKIRAVVYGLLRLAVRGSENDEVRRSRQREAATVALGSMVRASTDERFDRFLAGALISEFDADLVPANADSMMRLALTGANPHFEIAKFLFEYVLNGIEHERVQKSVISDLEFSAEKGYGSFIKHIVTKLPKNFDDRERLAQ